jgi:hypothetical protein
MLGGASNRETILLYNLRLAFALAVWQRSCVREPLKRTFRLSFLIPSMHTFSILGLALNTLNILAVKPFEICNIFVLV